MDEDLAAMANAVGAAVARQLGAHLTDLMKRFDEQVAATHRAADRLRAEVPAGVDRRLEGLPPLLEPQREASESFQREMLAVLDERVRTELRGFHVRLEAVEAHPLHVAAGTAAAGAEIRATMD